MMLTKHFSLEEFLHSETGERLGIDNTPDAQVQSNLLRTAHLMERVRELLGKPITITSGYRCAVLNKAIGGSVNSAHMSGLAADFICPAYGTPYNVCSILETQLQTFEVDQLIFEHTWTHIALRDGQPRHQVLTLIPGQGYAIGLVTR